MKFRNTDEYQKIAEVTELVRFNSEYSIGDFNCGVKDYNDFLINDAQAYIDLKISQVFLLLNKDSQDVIGYIAFLADTIALIQPEKNEKQLTVPFSTFPALKIGKLAVSIHHNDYHYGSFLLEIAVGFAEMMNNSGIACRFLTVDADIEYNPRTPEFYSANFFVRNLNERYTRRTQIVSMRYDIFDH